MGIVLQGKINWNLIVDTLAKVFIFIYGEEHFKLIYLLCIVLAEMVVDYMTIKESKKIIKQKKYVYDGLKKIFIYTIFIFTGSGVISMIGIDIGFDIRKIIIVILFFLQVHSLFVKIGLLGYKKESSVIGKAIFTIFKNSEMGKDLNRMLNEEKTQESNINEIKEEIENGRNQATKKPIVEDRKRKVIESRVDSRDEKLEGEDYEKTQ